MSLRWKHAVRAASAAFLIAASTSSFAQAYPAKPIRWILPFAPGGGTDIISRAIHPPLASALGQPLILENRPANAGLIAADAVAKSAPDGYTIMTGGNSSLMFAKLTYPKLPFDPERDFSPITMLALAPVALFVHESVPSKSVREFVEYSRSQGGRLNYGAAGLGHPFMLAMELLKRRTGLDILFVPYKGMEPVVQDLIAGRLHAMFYIPSEQVLSQVRAGKIRALATATDTRLRVLPDTQTFQEAGVADFAAAGWIALVGPAGMPRDIVMRLNREVVRILSLPDVAKVYSQLSLVPAGGTPEELSKKIHDDLVAWEPVVKSLGISLNY